MNKNERLLIGAKVLKVERVNPCRDMEGDIVDDDNHVIITTDKGVFDFYASFGCYTGNSLDEYPSYLSIIKREDLGSPLRVGAGGEGSASRPSDIRTHHQNEGR